MESGKIWYNSSKLLLDVSNYMAALFLINISQKAKRTKGECNEIDHLNTKTKGPGQSGLILLSMNVLHRTAIFSRAK